MKKLLIGAVVGGLILFVWQFLSWTVLQLHEPMQQYTPKQQEVLDYLGKNLDEGFYFMPTLPTGSSQEEYEKLMIDSGGKPWAQVYYHKAMNTSMGGNMTRGVVIDIVSVLLLCWILMKMGNASFQTIALSSLAVGLISYFTTSYTSQIWYETKSIPDLIDAVVQWGLVGAWLGWWLTRK